MPVETAGYFHILSIVTSEPACCSTWPIHCEILPFPSAHWDPHLCTGLKLPTTTEGFSAQSSVFSFPSQDFDLAALVPSVRDPSFVIVGRELSSWTKKHSQFFWKAIWTSRLQLGMRAPSSFPSSSNIHWYSGPKLSLAILLHVLELLVLPVL